MSGAITTHRVRELLVAAHEVLRVTPYSPRHIATDADGDPCNPTGPVTALSLRGALRRVASDTAESDALMAWLSDAGLLGKWDPRNKSAAIGKLNSGILLSTSSRKEHIQLPQSA